MSDSQKHFSVVCFATTSLGASGIASSWRLGVGVLCTSLLFTACTPGYMRKSADREVGGILKGKSSAVPNAGEELLDITPPSPISLEAFNTSDKNEAFLGDRAKIEKNARVIPLSEALKLAVSHNREYQSQKELLHLQALDLTLARHQFTPIFTGTNTSGLENSSGGPLTDAQITNLVNRNTFTSTSGLGLSALSRTGARIATDFTTDFLKLVSGNLSGTHDSRLAVTVTQPLLRGAGYRATMETLTQAERDLMYAIRDFTQYRKTFAVDIATRYYRTLEARQIAQNGYAAFQGFETLLVSERALQAEDKRSSSQLGLIEQAALRYERLWINAVRSYENQLDDLKLALAIPVTTPVVLDQKELARLQIDDPKFGYEQSLEAAMTSRLDLENSRNAVEDTRRKIKNAEQDLLPQLDLTAGYQTVSDPATNKVSLNTDRRNYGAGLDLDLRLDKKADRNAYRSTLIAQQRTARQLILAEENVRAALRTAWRDLDTARKQHELAETGVKLSQRRLEEERLLNELGRGAARDLIDAQQDLIEARDAQNAALVSHNIARLRLWKDMGVLYIQKDGSWITVLENEAR